MSDYPELSQALVKKDALAAATAFVHGLSGGADPRQLVRAAVSAAAPLVNRPYYVELDTEGRLVRREVHHGMLAVGAAIGLGTYLPESERSLPLAWAMWHLAKSCTEKPPAWLSSAMPLPASDAKATVDAMVTATIEGRTADAYGHWLAASEDPSVRDYLSERLLYLGAINLEESIDRQLKHLGHKAVYAEKTLALLDYVGWDMAPLAGLPGVAYLATGPQLFNVYDLVWSKGLFPFPEQLAENSFRLSEEDQEGLVQTILGGHRDQVQQQLSDLLNSTHSVADLTSAVSVAAATFLLNTHVGEWAVPLQGFTYSAAVNHWVRHEPAPLRVFGPCLGAALTNDITQYYRTINFVALAELDRIPGDTPLQRIQAALEGQDAAEAAALVLEYLQAGGSEDALCALLARCAARWGSYEHAIKLAQAALDEYKASTASGKAVILAALAKYLSAAPHDETVTQLYRQHVGP